MKLGDWTKSCQCESSWVRRRVCLRGGKLGQLRHNGFQERHEFLGETCVVISLIYFISRLKSNRNSRYYHCETRLAEFERGVCVFTITHEAVSLKHRAESTSHPAYPYDRHYYCQQPSGTDDYV